MCRTISKSIFGLPTEKNHKEDISCLKYDEDLTFGFYLIKYKCNSYLYVKVFTGGRTMNYKVKIDRTKTGERLRLIFINRRVSFEMVANLIGLSSPRVIYDWISGIKLPSLDNWVNLSNIFKFKLEDVLVIEESFIFEPSVHCTYVYYIL